MRKYNQKTNLQPKNYGHSNDIQGIVALFFPIGLYLPQGSDRKARKMQKLTSIYFPNNFW